MDHNTSYMNTNYARDKMIESYHREEEQNTAKGDGATEQAGIMRPPERRKDDDEADN